MAVSKNNPNARKAAVQKMVDGKPVKPVKYIGSHGIYIAGQYDNGDIITNKDSDKPVPYGQL